MKENCEMRHPNGICRPTGKPCAADIERCKALHEAYSMGYRAATVKMMVDRAVRAENEKTR